MQVNISLPGAPPPCSSTASDLDSNGKVNASWARVWKMNSPEAFLILVGLLSAALQGAIYPMFAYFFGQVLRVFTLPFDQVVGAIHVWAGTFLILGAISGISTFFKVRIYRASLVILMDTKRTARQLKL